LFGYVTELLTVCSFMYVEMLKPHFHFVHSGPQYESNEAPHMSICP